MLCMPFDNSEFEKHQVEVRERWGKTDAYRQHAEKTGHYTEQKWQDLGKYMWQSRGSRAILTSTERAPPHLSAKPLKLIAAGKFQFPASVF